MSIIRPTKIAILMSGHELMTGDVVDTNYLLIADYFQQLHLTVREKVMVGDEIKLLVDQLTRLIGEYDIVLVNGGLGPTSDDLTSAAIAQALKLPLETNKEAESYLSHWANKNKAKLSASNLKQTQLPKGASIFNDAIGSASGYWLNHQQKLIIATPGVPNELAHLLASSIPVCVEGMLGKLEKADWHKITLFGIGEAQLQELVNKSPLTSLPIEIGFRAHSPYIEFKYRLTTALDQTAIRAIQQQVLTLIQPFYVGLGNTSMELVTSQVLRKSNLTLAVAESCTGGLITHQLVKIAGASTFLYGGIVCYSNKMKQNWLEIPEETLIQYGAVSHHIAELMLINTLNKTKADVGIATTGIAGPDGGTDEKPVGTIYIAFGRQDNYHVICLCLPFGREKFQFFASTIALDCLRHYIVEETLPSYLKKWLIKS